jgi:Protein of unknown function (DUF4245)
MADVPNAPTPTPDAPHVAVRHSRTARDMTLSLIVLLIPLAVIVTLYRLRGGEDVVVVDPAPSIAQAQAAKLFPVAAPQGLSPDWRPISATFQTSDSVGTLRVGYITPSDGALQLIESNEDARSLLARELGDQVRPQGQVTVNGQLWQSSTVRGDERALVDTSSERTLMVVGRASLDELTVLAQSLH